MADKPIPGDKYVRTLSHYLRSNQRRLLPPTPPPVPAIPASFAATTAAQARSLVTPVDPMAAAYENMVSSLWSATAAVVSSITSTSSTDRPVSPQERDIYTGAWDGTGAILPDSNPSERQLYLSAQLRSPIFPLDLYYLLYLLERFEQVGIDLEGWNGTTAKPVGDSKPRVIMQDNAQKRHSIAIVTPAGVDSGLPNSASISPFPLPAATNGGNVAAPGLKNERPESIRSFQSAALSTLTLITGWKQWSTAASSSSSNLTITDDVHFIQKFMRHIPSLRLVAKIPPGEQFQGKGRIEGFGAEAILTLFNHGHPVPAQGSSSSSNGDSTSNSDSNPLFLLPLAATFPALTHLELHKIPPDSIEGWTELMKQLKSLVILQSGMEDVYDIMVKPVIDSERRRRERISREKSRAVLIQKEQQEALKDAALTSQELENDSAAKDESPNSNGFASFTASSGPGVDPLEPDALILSSLKMWPVLRHLSLSDNSLPTLAQNDTFVHTQAIVSLDLSHNLFLSPPSALIHLHNLHHLNLSYNMISGVQSIYQILGNIAILDLRGNRLESLSGLERLWNLEKVDVRENHLDEAAEVGRLAALPGIREVWSERNPFCMIQPKYRLEILAVFKANGHDLMLDGSFASFTEKRSLANMSPSSFSTTISSINNVANIPSASAPIATFAKELARPEPIRHSRAPSKVDEALMAATQSPPGSFGAPPVSKLVKKKLVKSTKRVKRVVNLDSDHEEETVPGPNDDGKGLASLESDEDKSVSVQLPESKLGSPVVLEKKKKKKKVVKSSGSPTGEATLAVDGSGQTNDVDQGSGQEKDKVKKKGTKKKNAGGVVVAAPVTVAPAVSAAVGIADDVNDPSIDHSLCRDDHHIHRHRLAHLEKSIASKQLGRAHTSYAPLVAPLATGGYSSAAGSPSLHQRHPSRGILKRNPSMPVNNSGAISPRLRPSSPIGSFCSDDGGADGYRRRIEAMRNEAGKNWLMVLAEMDKDIAREEEYAREHGEQ